LSQPSPSKGTIVDLTVRIAIAAEIASPTPASVNGIIGLNRDFGRKRWGDEGYAMEELVAELGSAFLSADLDLALEPRADHAAYIDSWLKVLKADKRAIFSAASHAQRAADYLKADEPWTL
jgi:antirestriction protein ArdC